MNYKDTNKTSDNTAYLSSIDGYTVFRYKDTYIRFKAPYSLEKYIEVTHWDNGYIVVNTKYSHSKELIEEYIDLIPILNDLYMNADEFLAPITNVKVAYGW